MADKPHTPVISFGSVFGLFSWLRHSAKEYPALLNLRQLLAQDTSSNQSVAIAAVTAHFLDEKNKWNNHSFNNYLLDEIQKHCSPEEWDEHWRQFDKQPIHYYSGILFRGTGDEPASCFKNGLFEKNDSRNLNDYITDMNGSIGLSTSKVFSVANTYALPAIRLQYNLENADIWNESYIYVIDYQGEVGIDLESTLNARLQTDRASLSHDKAEVNVIGKIDAQNIIGAFYVNRMNEIKWHANPNYQGNVKYEQLKDQMPSNFYQKMMENAVAHTSYRSLKPTK